MSQRLVEEIERERRASQRMVTVCSWLSAILTLVGVVASLIVTVCAATRKLEGLTLAFVATLPGAAVALQRYQWLDARTSWHTERVLGLKALQRALLFGGEDEKTVSERLTAFELALENKWNEMRLPRLMPRSDTDEPAPSA